MKKVQRPWGDVVADLNVALKECDLSLHDLSALSGCNYFALWRYKHKGVSSRTKAAIGLCSFFKVSTEYFVKLQNNPIDTVIGAVQEAWDGSPAHAELMARLIRSTKEFSVTRSQHKNQR